MKINLKELAPLRLPAFALAAVAVCAWLLVTYTDSRLGAAQRELQAATAALQNARAQYQRSGEEKESILRYGPAYEQLREEGFVGAERRIAWLEALHNVDRRVGLFGVRYQIEAQQQYDGPLSVPMLSSRLRSSQMVLDFGVAHEGDLLRFLETLRSQKVGVFSVRSCSLNPAGREAAPEPRRPNLRANCDIRWLTIQGPGEETS
jgi:hypothetical protein